MKTEHEAKIREIIAATGAHGVAADAIFAAIDDIVQDERDDARSEGYFQGQESEVRYRNGY